ncbi:ABC transporter ATP-binding protein [Nocardia sp. BMG51109]|uniref:ABC transporter ATP-binding protein n=1 Tax=Nocardia sp. BMG51109 TaxID=1056816 RepID=UPI0009FC21BA|nr:ATP-binding cassette domain-containing protein [Nocardia sp. BMG51109]
MADDGPASGGAAHGNPVSVGVANRNAVTGRVVKSGVLDNDSADEAVADGGAVDEEGPVVLSVRGLTARAGAAVLVEDVDFDVRAGQIITLFGPSGAGKTTIAAALAGVDRPGIEIGGEIRRAGEPGRLRVGYLPQNAAATLNPARRIGAALGELAELHHRRAGGRRRGRARRRAHVAQALSSAAFDIVDADLDRFLRKFPHQFSGGERARLALAQVLACEPDVLVVDEPTVGLDSIARADLLAGLAGLRCAGKAVVLITHDPFAADRISDRILFVRAGRLVADGSTAADEPARRPAAPRTARPAVRLREVSLALRGTPVLRSVDLELGQGELLGMIGVSGAGKSTLARCVAGLVAPDSGAVLLDGAPIPVLRKRSRAQIAAVQYVWQESASSFDPRRPVLDQVAATGVRLRGLDRESARSAAVGMLADLGIDGDQARRHPSGLSGGELQRAALTRALLAHPRVLICDEITTALDRPMARRILDYVDEYRRSTGAAVLSISHDLRGQLGRADRIAIVDRGRIAETGTPETLLAHPETTIMRSLLDAEQLDHP